MKGVDDDVALIIWISYLIIFQIIKYGAEQYIKYLMIFQKHNARLNTLKKRRDEPGKLEISFTELKGTAQRDTIALTKLNEYRCCLETLG